jgi:hypothetical protein
MTPLAKRGATFSHLITGWKTPTMPCAAEF